MEHLFRGLKLILQNGTVTLPDEVDLAEPIKIPTFIDFEAVSVFSLIAFIGVAATIGIVVFWIYKIIRLAIEGIQSEGKPEKIGELRKRLQNILLGTFMSFLFPIILSVIGIFAGIGTIFEWPRMFSDCNSDDYNYYFQAFLDLEGENATAAADAECN